MDPTLVNDASFSTANPSSYSLSEIWPFHGSRGGRGGGGRMAGDKDTGLRIGWPVEGNSSRNASIDESTVTEQSESRRKRRESASEDDSSKFGSSSSDNNLNDSKRMKATVTAYQIGKSKGEAEASSKADKMADEEAKFSELPKQEYIHVRARRGQATDNHSLAERARREKISERMKILQDLVPGCNKVIGKASVLDEIINYIQALQHQVEFLSMKLEAVNTRVNPSMGEFQAKELRAQTFDAAGMMYGSDSLREYMQGPPSEWLHMQVGSSFERGP